MNSSDAKRYARQLILPEIGVAGQQRLRDARVLLVGVGGLGSPIALYLAAAGVGCLALIDDDVVSESNLQRQVLYTNDEIGQPKVRCAARRLKALNPQLQVDEYPLRLVPPLARHIVKAYDIVVDGTDNFQTRYLLGDVTAQLGKPYVYGAIREFEGQVSVFNISPGRTYRTLFPEEEMGGVPPKGVMGVLPGVIGCVEASEVIKWITGCGELLDGRLWTINLLTMQTQVIEY